MKRAIMLALALAAACAPGSEAQLQEMVLCATMAAGAGLEPGECRMEANGEALHVRFAAVPADATGGAVSIDVIDHGGAVRQVLLEQGVAEYLPPSVQDIDGDGRGDILIARESGNVNVARGVWILGGDGLYRRAGEVSGVSIERTGEGYIAVPARSSAAAWNIAFHRLDEAGLHLLASVNVEAEERSDGAIAATCALADAPGVSDMGLTLAEAEAKFCAEPAAIGVFGP